MHVPPQDYVFIADEAGISNDRFTVVGGVCMHRETLRRAYDTMLAYREKHNMKSELKWGKVSPGKLAEYMALVDYFFCHEQRQPNSFSLYRLRFPRMGS